MNPLLGFLEGICQKEMFVLVTPWDQGANS